MRASTCLGRYDPDGGRAQQWLIIRLGVPFTSDTFTGRIKESGIRISMNDRSRCIDIVMRR